MDRILVTGGAGFLGSHLCEKLLANDNHVICIDNHFTGNAKNIKHLKTHRNFEHLAKDVTQPIDLQPQLDQIYNLACPASPKWYTSDPVATLDINYIGTSNALKLARLHGARLLQASTSEVYGDPHIHPQTEDYRGNVNPLGIRACYDEGKRSAETQCFNYHRQYRLDIRVARIFNTYGPRMGGGDGRVISTFIMQALTNQPLTIYGDGNQTRSFCYVSDLIDGLVKFMNTDNITGPVNLGNPIETTMNTLADLILELTDSKSKKTYEKLPEDDPCRRKPDITVAKQKLAWEPKVSLEDGLTETINWFKKQQNGHLCPK